MKLQVGSRFELDSDLRERWARINEWGCAKPKAAAVVQAERGHRTRALAGAIAMGPAQAQDGEVSEMYVSSSPGGSGYRRSPTALSTPGNRTVKCAGIMV